MGHLVELAVVTFTKDRPREHDMTRLPIPVIPKWARWAVVGVIVAGIFYKSLLTVPSQAVPKPDFTPVDKWLHFVAYAGLGLTVAYALVESPLSRKRRAVLLLSIVVGYGVAMEVGQAVLPSRYFSVGDLLANTLGGILSLTWYIFEPFLKPIHILRMEPSSRHRP